MSKSWRRQQTTTSRHFMFRSARRHRRFRLFRSARRRRRHFMFRSARQHCRHFVFSFRWTQGLELAPGRVTRGTTTTRTTTHDYHYHNHSLTIQAPWPPTTSGPHGPRLTTTTTTTTVISTTIFDHPGSLTNLRLPLPHGPRLTTTTLSLAPALSCPKMLAKLFELLKHLHLVRASAQPLLAAQPKTPRLVDASSAERLVAPTHSLLRAAWCTDFSVCAAWRGFLILLCLGQLASAAARTLHSQLAPDLFSIGQQFTDKAERPECSDRGHDGGGPGGHGERRQ